MKVLGTLAISAVGLTTSLINVPPTPTTSSIDRHAEFGIASIYSSEPTANGEYAYPTDFTAAHKTLPFGTLVKVTNLANGRAVIVRINDRGPYVPGRIIDLTPAGAKAIGFTEHGAGLAPVTVTPFGVTENS